jgi:ATP-binding cassette, subfamily B, bacterial CvaB/MchF/RaxB
MNALGRLNLSWSTRLPMVLQTEAAECGLACVAMIAAYHGQATDLATLRQRYGFSLKGATLKDIVSLAERTGFASRAVRLEVDELQNLKTPCLMHWDLNHFVVLKEVSAKGITIHDPAVGVRNVAREEISRRFSGVALELTPLGNFTPAAPPPRVRFRSLIGHLVGLRRSLGQLLVIALAIEIFSIVSPFFMQWVVDHALVTADRDLLVTLALGFGLLLLLRVAIAAMRGWMLMSLSASLTVQGRTNLFSHLVNLPAAYFEARYMGDVMSRFGSQDTILSAITTDLIEVFLDGLFAVLTLIVMFILAPMLAGVVVFGAVLYGLLRWATYTPLRQASAEAIVWAARRDSHFLETMRGIKTIKLFNGQQERRGHWLNLLVETINRQLTTQKLRLFFRICNMLLLGVLAIVIVLLSAHRVLDGTFTVGMMLAFIAYKDQFLSRVIDIINRVVDLHMLRLHAERLADIALTPPESGEAWVYLGNQDAPRTLEVNQLRFRYSEHEPWVLDGVDFKIAPGESVAIVGPSGCGKTTLLKLLASLLQPTSGEIRWAGRPLDRVGVQHYRAEIGVVMQDDQLFAGSIADNISFFGDRPDMQRIEECAKLAAVHEEITAMPMGFHTLIGDMGTVLSGGQKQRVLVARALYRRPNILLLDEATSHLDSARERTLNANVREMQIMRVIVAHRQETIRSADRIIYLDKGKIVRDTPSGIAGVTELLQ